MVNRRKFVCSLPYASDSSKDVGYNALFGAHKCRLYRKIQYNLRFALWYYRLFLLFLPYAVFCATCELPCVLRYNLHVWHLSFGSAGPSSGFGMTLGSTLEELTGLFDSLCGCYFYRKIQYRMHFPGSSSWHASLRVCFTFVIFPRNSARARLFLHLLVITVLYVILPRSSPLLTCIDSSSTCYVDLSTSTCIVTCAMFLFLYLALLCNWVSHVYLGLNRPVYTVIIPVAVMSGST